ncbi:MAG: hypothetical protein WA652_16420 [Xanthobacteraceae bacterium]
MNSLPSFLLLLPLLCAAAVAAQQDKPLTEPGSAAIHLNASDQPYDANAHPYVDLPFAQLVERIPELKTLQPAPDEQDLPEILQKLGRSVDDFVREIGDLIAHEDVTQERLDAKGKIKAKERVQDSYLILHHSADLQASTEYRMDKKGNRLGPIGLKEGYVVTAGYALDCIRFSTAAQPQSRFRYLGEEKIGSRDTYVLAFAQKPGEATLFTTVKETGGADVSMLTQGILWVDKNSSQIIRMRSDLLEPAASVTNWMINNGISLNQMTTEVTFSEVQLKDVPNPLWLPSDVDVYMEIEKHKFHNLHHYTNYRRYRVSVKIGTAQ